MNLNKTILAALIITGCLLPSTVKAQFDSMFYYPSKAYVAIDSLKYAEFSIPVEKEKITGIQLSPTQQPKGTILFFHGAGGNVSNYVFMVRPLVKAGYQVYMIDFQGYGKSTGTPTHQNIAKDGQVFFDYVLKQKDSKKLPVIIYGASMGTQIATKLAKDNASKIQGFVFDGGMSSLTEIAVSYSPAEQHNMIRNSLKFPYSAIEDITAIQNVPMLFCISTTDKTVPTQQSKDVFEKAIAPKKVIYFTEDHLQVTTSHTAELVEEINKMMHL